ncbi:polysaccharide pyruvyl transferase family protein [Ravibacter arvi]|uniref:Polysaccharide pyruvyl transferase family protein n=1 Tax=Ravibacter arvi TaxID=2051041 RepID=A0ABP8LSW5_9BACT
MVFKEKIEELKSIIIDKMLHRIDSDYVLLDLPYHTNIGDTLIWEGEEDFLSLLPYNCLYRSSFDTFKHKEIPENTIVLMHGGGNFGDLWRPYQDFRLDIVQRYPHNRIIFFPQTVHYSNETLAIRDAEILARHKQLTICARDSRSFNFLKEYFSNEILLVPDMAFCIKADKLEKFKRNVGKNVLLLRRSDQEAVLDINYGEYIKDESELKSLDWPSMEKPFSIQVLIYKFLRRIRAFGSIEDWYTQQILRHFLVKTGVEFLSEYKYIYTTRLHGAILSILLNKSFFFFDNSYGKNSSFFDTWLSDLEHCKFIHR